MRMIRERIEICSYDRAGCRADGKLSPLEEVHLLWTGLDTGYYVHAPILVTYGCTALVD